MAYHNPYRSGKSFIPHLAVLDPAKKEFERLIFPTKYGIPKSSKGIRHWLSKIPYIQQITTPPPPDHCSGGVGW